MRTSAAAVHRSPIQFALFLAFALASLLSVPKAGFACSCLPPGPPEEALRDSVAVFAGEAVAVKPRGAEGESPMSYEVQFEVSRAWKGAEGRVVTVTTAGNSAACGFHFEEGREYLVYAYRPEGGSLMTGLCNRTAPFPQAADDAQALGEGRIPPEAPASAEEPRAVGMTRSEKLLAGSIVALAVLGYVIGRNGRR